jgi:hypothetical protein
VLRSSRACPSRRADIRRTSGTVRDRHRIRPGPSLAPCRPSALSCASSCRAAASPAAHPASGCASGAVRTCVRSRRHCVPAAARPRRWPSRPAAPAAGCAGSRRRAPRCGWRALRSRSSHAGSGARSRRPAWPPRSWRTSCPGRPSRLSPSFRRCETACWCAGPTRRRSWLPSSLAGGASLSWRSCAEPTASVPSAGSTRASAAATCAAPSRPAPDPSRSRSSTTSTPPAQRSMNAPGRCCRPAPARCTS